METEDPERQKLIDVQLEPARWFSSAEEASSESDFSEDSCGGEVQWWPRGGPCPELRVGAPAAEQASRRQARRRLVLACALSLVFMTGEVIGGYAAHSLAILTDAAHLLSDFCSILLSLFSLWLSSRPRSHTMTFGWHRAEILAVLLSVLSIWGVSVVLVWWAAVRLSEGDFHIDSNVMLLTSGCAVVVNVLMVLILHQPGAAHSHSLASAHVEGGRAVGHGPRRGHSHSNSSVRAAFIHVLGDLLQSMGVLLSATLIHFRPDFKAADPICTFVFSVLVLWTTFPVIKDVLRILMEACPEHIAVDKVHELLMSVPGVVSAHSLRIWSLNQSHFLMSGHVITDEDSDSQLVLMKATNLLCGELAFSSITLQVERSSSGSRTQETE